jgi:MFS family permease
VQPLKDNRRILLAAAVGTAIEYYDFFIFATATALVFGPEFFPGHDPATKSLMAFLAFGVGFVARPLGGVIFGHFGDRYGRKSTLVATLLLMGASTLGIAFLPTYATCAAWGVGWLAPLLLCTMRFGQGLGLGGEWAGAVLLALENAPRAWRSRFGAITQVGVPVGFLLANLTFLGLGLLLKGQFTTWGWRIPFLASALLIGLGLWVRLRLVETPEFAAAMARGARERVPIGTLLRGYRRAVLVATAGSVTIYALFYIGSAFALAEASGQLGYEPHAFLGIELLGALFLIAGTIIAGWNSDLATPGRTLALGAVGTMVMGLVFWPALVSGSLAIAGTMICVLMFAQGFNAGSLSAWLAPLFPVELRYSGVALAYALGGVIGGALVPIAAQAMSARGAPENVGMLLVIAGLTTLLAVLVADRDMRRAGLA